jgi:hypothetical protein
MPLGSGSHSGNYKEYSLSGCDALYSGVSSPTGHVGFMMDKVALEQGFSECFGFPCQFSFHRLLNMHHHLSPEAVTRGQTAADVPSELILTPTQANKKKNISPKFLASRR